jgi:DNA-cytosine methyltransferase
MLKVLDLFSGIGGFSLGLESTGHFETIAFCEKDEFCQKVLQKNFKNIPIEGDVRNVKGDKYKADVVTGGFPCQPFSVAGKRKGTDDDRYLWDETIRVVRECKPKWFIGENVEGLINIQEGMVLRQVQTDLEKEGFEVQCLIIPASGIGAWHQRKRVWIIGCNVSNSNTRFGIGENQEVQTRWNTINNGSSSNVSNTQSKWSRECRELDKKKRLEESKSTQSDCICSDVPNSDSRMRRRGRTIGESGTNQVWGFHTEKEKQSEQNFRSKTIGCDDIPREEDAANSDKQRTQVQTKRKQSSIKMSGSSSQKNWWQTQSELCGVPNGVSYELDKDRANRVKSLGNSIVPQIARELGKAIIIAEND